MISVILAVLSAVFAASTAILAKIGVSEVKSDLATALRTGVVLVMAALVCLVFGQFDFCVLTPRALLFLLLSGFSTALSWLCYFRALQLGSVSKVVPLDKLSTVFVMVLAFTVLREPLSWQSVTGGALISAGAVIMALGKREGEKRSGLAVILALCSALFAAATSVLAKIGMENVPSNFATLIRTVVILIFAWTVVFAKRQHREIRNISRKSLFFLVLSGVTTGLSWLCYFAAISLGRISIVAPIDKFSVVLTLIFGFIFLKERVDAKAIAGCILITAGTVFLILG